MLPRAKAGKKVKKFRNSRLTTASKTKMSVCRPVRPPTKVKALAHNRFNKSPHHQKLKAFIDWKKTNEENIIQENGKKMLMYSDHTVCYKVFYSSGLFKLKVAKKDHNNGLLFLKAKELKTNKDIIFKYRNKKKAI